MNALRSTIKLASRSVNQKVQKRGMGSAAQPQWTGIDKVIRDRFPEDWQVSGLILGGYTLLFTLVSLKPSGKADPVPVAKPVASSTSAIPSVDDPAFADFIENEA